MDPFEDDFEGFWVLFGRSLGRFFDEFVFDFGRGVSLVASGEPFHKTLLRAEFGTLLGWILHDLGAKKTLSVTAGTMCQLKTSFRFLPFSSYV